MKRKAAFDAWDASISKVSEIVADFECQSDILRPLCTPESALQDTLDQLASSSFHGMALEDACWCFFMRPYLMSDDIVNLTDRCLDQRMGELEKIEAHAFLICTLIPLLTNVFRVRSNG